MGSIIDKLNRTKSVIEALCTQLNNTVSSDYKCYSLKDIENRMNKIYMLTRSTDATVNRVKKGFTYYTGDGVRELGTWEPYSGSTVTAENLVKGVKAYDVNGKLITGTHECSGGSSTTGFDLTINNNSSYTRLVTGFTGINSNTKVTPTFVDAGNSYTFPKKINIGDVIPIIVLVNSNKFSSPIKPYFNVGCPIAIFQPTDALGAISMNPCYDGVSLNDKLGLDNGNYYVFGFIGICYYQTSGSLNITLSV